MVLELHDMGFMECSARVGCFTLVSQVPCPLSLQFLRWPDQKRVLAQLIQLGLTSVSFLAASHPGYPLKRPAGRFERGKCHLKLLHVVAGGALVVLPSTRVGAVGNESIRLLNCAFVSKCPTG